MTCAIQLDRYKLPVCLFEKRKPGGLLLNANWVENFPAFPSGISGAHLSEKMKDHFFQSECVYYNEEVFSVSFNGEIFTICSKKRKIQSRFLVVASGTKPGMFSEGGVSAEEQKHIFYEIDSIQDLKEQKIGIIGGGDAAYDYALNLSRFNSVILFQRSINACCLPVLEERVQNNPEITIMRGFNIQSLRRVNNAAWRITGFDNKNRTAERMFDYCIAAIGRKPNLDCLNGFSESEKDDALRLKRLYFAGDVKNANFRQAVIAAGDGMRTAMEIANSKRSISE